MKPIKSSAHLYEYEVVSNEEIAHNVFELVFECAPLAQSLVPGQFFNLEVPGDERELLRIPFSFSEVDARIGHVHVIYQIMGAGTERLSKLSPGTKATVIGPGGHGWEVRPNTSKALLVGGGLGVAPLMPFAEMLTRSGIEFDFVIGANTASRIYGVEYLEELNSCDVYIATDDGSFGHSGFNTEICTNLLEDATKDEAPYDLIATCGPFPMMRAVASQAKEAGIHCLVSMETKMMCGFGACNSCTVETVAGPMRCCIAGPVFNAAGVIWDA